jgi:hypothetical protein
LSTAEATLGAQSEAMSEQDQQLDQAKRQAQMQAAIENARREFQDERLVPLAGLGNQSRF